MVEKTRKEEVVSREYTINLHKRLHGWRIRVHIARKRNDEEDAKEELNSLVTVTEIPPEGLKGLCTKVIEGDD
ncbi:60s ribosomal protein l31 [Quercus suber]|uniref:60s ribosomal protein l31 n=1 Tax=Quercus suber TaxID=58331 RepID=A0AAW0M533_QUESU